ncbi:head GIN domain-containing protein [Allosphingosinicella vermicomposti]|uniref:head GIN domain-containing protein n=1 Tax=Allosphingosinicella vermicomposti TaxID=614671 RepID=UPI000D0FCFAC|nr:head GIN domain-containing protein [Allosphingosinicella vermicomposti]
MHLSLLLATAAAALAGCNMSANAQRNDTASTAQTQRSFDVGAFDSIELEGPHDVTVAVGSAPSIRAEGAANVLEEMEVVVESDGNLVIRDKKDGLNWGRNRKPAKVFVTVPSLKAAAIGGSGDMRIDRVTGDDFAAAVGGSGNIDLASLTVAKASFSIGGSGNIKAAGKVDDMSAAIAGSGNIGVGEVESRRASVSIAGSGNANVRASESADINIVGSGDVHVGGGAKCTVNKMGSGDVECGA